MRHLWYGRMKIVFIFLSIFITLSSCSKQEEAQEDFCSKLHVRSQKGLTDYFEKQSENIKTKTAVHVLEDGGGSLITRAWFTQNAQKSIDIQYFIFSTDNVGLIACDFLVRAADRGIKVRLLVDDMMVDSEIDDILTMDSHPNIEIKVYNPGVNLGKNIIKKLGKFAFDFKNANLRMHNKTFIVDGKVGITGGRNIADEYFDYDHEYNFRDRDVLLIGKAVNNMQQSFNEFWENDNSVAVTQISDKKIEFEPGIFEKLHQYACNPKNFWPQVRTQLNDFQDSFNKITRDSALVWVQDVKFVSDFPGKNRIKKGLSGGGNTTQALIELINNAKTRIDIQTPYLITTQLGKKVFKDAVKRGVKVRILTNSLASTDNLEAFSGYQRDRKELLATGVEIYEFRPDAKERFEIMTGAYQKKVNFTPIFGLHAKSMLIDNNISIIGTFNLDPRSANLNTECFAIIYDETITKTLHQYFETDFLPENSWHITPKFNPDHIVNLSKRIKVKTRRVVPKSIL